MPSWGRVLATTLGLWASRRLSLLRLRRTLLLLVICVLVLGVAAVGAVRLTGASSLASSSGRPHQVRSGGAEVAAAAASAALTVRSQAAAWIAGQVSSAETIACDPPMCVALGARGVATSRLVPLEAASSGPGAGVILASSSARGSTSQDAPVLLASFGSGASQIQVRATAPGGNAAYRSALAADLAARRSAGAQLLHSGRLVVSAEGAGQLQAGEVDSRLLIMLAMLASQHPWRVTFGGASPGVPTTAAPFRQIVLTGEDGPGASGADGRAVAAALALVRAQRDPYQPVQADVVQPADGQAELLIDFAAPSPLGLLTGGAPG